MRKLFCLFLLFPAMLSAQQYVDILKINYGETFKNKFENSSSHTKVKSFEAELLYPIRLNTSHAIVTGVDHTSDYLQLAAEAHHTRLYNTTLKLGLASQWNETWSSSIILLPKMASDYKDLSSEDFYIGIYATIAKQQTENFKYRFGLYSSSEAFGTFLTPIIGWHYLSPNKRFEMNMNLPINAVMTYNVGEVDLGLDFFGISRSFRVYQKDEKDLYVDLSSLRFSSFVQKEILDNSLLLRAKFGYSTNDYQLYEMGDKLDLRLSAFDFGDNRTQLNADIKGSLFFKFEMIYRFHL